MNEQQRQSSQSRYTKSAFWYNETGSVILSALVVTQNRLKLKTYPGAQKAIDALEECGLLALARTKPKVYIAKPVVDILSPETPREKQGHEGPKRRGRAP